MNLPSNLLSPGSTLSFTLPALLLAVSVGCGGKVASDAAVATPTAADPRPPGRDILAVATITELRLITLDGSHRSVLVGDPFFAGATGVDLIGGGRFLVVRAYAESSPGSGLRMALVRSDGAVQWTKTFPVSFAGGADDSALHWGVTLGEEGAVVLDDRNSSNFHIASLGSSIGELPGYFPIGRSIDGFVPVRSAWTATGPTSTTFGWWKVGGGAELSNVTHSTSGSGVDANDPIAFAGRQLRLADHGGIVLRAESPTDSTEIALPDLTDAARVSYPTAGEMFAADERWLLVETGVDDRVVRVDLRTRTSETIALAAPAKPRPSRKS